MDRVARQLYWVTPSLICLALYWDGLRAWFQQDDFAWLGLHLRVHDWSSFLWAMFAPLAQGTIRPISERLFFMTFTTAFGLDALPFRIFVFLTQFGNLVLLTLIVRRLTGSALAAWLAPVLWIANSALSIPMSWTSAYNQILCSACLLLAFYFFLRFIESGDRRFYWAQWAVFLTGFGVLETNVVYPAIVALYCWLRERKHLYSTFPMFAVSIVYFVIHRAFAPVTHHDIYRMYFDTSMLSNFATFWIWAVSGYRLIGLGLLRADAALLLVAPVTIALFLFVFQALRRADRLPLFFLGWYAIVLAPYLPLRNHVSEYYPVIPTLGLAMLGAWAAASAWRWGTLGRTAAVLTVLLYAVPSGYVAWAETRINYYNAREARKFLQQMRYVQLLHPGKTIVLKGVSSNLFWNGFYGDPFRLFGLSQVYMTEDTEPSIAPFQEMGSIAHNFLPDRAALKAFETDRAVAYEVLGPQLRNITPLQHLTLRLRSDLREPARIDLGQSLYDGQLGDGWYPADKGGRWMSARATVRLRGPEFANDMVEIRGSCPGQLLNNGPITLAVQINGESVASHKIARDNAQFSFRCPVPPRLIGARSMELTLAVPRTMTFPPDERPLGLNFGIIQIVRSLDKTPLAVK